MAIKWKNEIENLKTKILVEEKSYEEIGRESRTPT